MDAARRERLTPLYGVVFVVLTVIGIVLTSMDSPEDFPGKVDEIVTYYQDNSGRIMTGAWIGLIGAFFNILFLGALVSRLRAAEGGSGRLSATAFAGGVLAVAMGLLIDITNAAAAFRVDEDEAISTEVATTLFDLQSMAFGGALPIALAALIAGTGAVALRTGVLPRWLGIASLILALGLLILPIAWALTAVALLWALVVSILLYLRPSQAAPAATPPPAAGTTPA
jgi:hypothetical protein